MWKQLNSDEFEIELSEKWQIYQQIYRLIFKKMQYERPIKNNI